MKKRKCNLINIKKIKFKLKNLKIIVPYINQKSLKIQYIGNWV